MTLDKFLKTEDEKEEKKEEEEVSFRQLVNNIPSTNYASHGIYYYPARFIPQVVRYAIANYSKKGDIVFDPFAGSGTVGVEAAIMGRKSILWDINPILEFLMKVKLLRVQKEDEEELLDTVKAMINHNGKSFEPNWKNKGHWYEKTFLKRFEKMWGYIHHELSDDYKLKIIIIFALLKTSRKFSYGDDRVPKLFKSKRKTKYIKELLQSEWKSYLKKFLISRTKDIFNRCLEFTETVGEKKISYKVEIGDALNKKGAPENVELIITSPPYFQAQEYIRSNKLELYWLKYDDDRIRQFTRAEIPYNKPNPVEIQSKTFEKYEEKIKSKRKDLITIYYKWFHSIINIFEKSFNSLNKNGHMAIFIGPSTIAGISVPIHEIIMEHFERKGAQHIKTLVDEIKSRRLFGNRLNPSPNGIPAEYLTILKKAE